MKTATPTPPPNTQSTPSAALHSLRMQRTGFLIILLLALFGLQPGVKAQTETFDSGAGIFSAGPNQWLVAQIHPAIPMVYTHPATAWGQGVRLQAHTGSGALPAAVGFIYRTNVYHDFYVSVDFYAWPGTDLNQALLLIAHGNNVNPPQDSSSYIINYDASQYGQGPTSRRQGQFQMSIVYPGFATIQLGIGEFTLVAGGRYRAILKGVDNFGIFDLTATLYDHTDLTRPLQTIFNQDSTYVDGVSGIGNFSREGATGTTDSTFENYFAAAADPDLDISPAVRHPISGTAQVVTRTPVERFTNFHPPASGITFTARTFNADNINVAATKLYLNNVDVSASLSSPAAAPTVSYTTPTSPLVANKVYSGRIEVESSTGKKGTNTFWFDTFTDAYVDSGAVKVIECEDYNYQNGLWQAGTIPVSGETTNGTIINGSGVGYYGLAGVEGVDFHDNRTTVEFGDGISLSQYRTTDPVGTYSGTFEVTDLLHPFPTTTYDLPIDHSNTRLKYKSQGMKEYSVIRTEVGEWLNYTRNFPNQNYHVYLRVGTFGASEVTLSKVTSDPTLPGQTTTPLGRFNLPNQFKRDNFLYQPLTVGCDQGPAVVNLSGDSTIRLTMAGTTGQDSRKLYLNYLLFVPTTDPVTSAVVLKSSSTVAGPYTNAAGASVNLATKTVTVPYSGSATFYRLCSDAAVTITSINVVGPNVVITYN